MPKRKIEKVKYRLMLIGGPSDNRIEDRECDVEAPPRLLFVPVPPADMAETEDECQWRVGAYAIKGPVDFEIMGVHYAYEWAGICE
jgi:hypothetical protein